MVNAVVYSYRLKLHNNLLRQISKENTSNNKLREHVNLA